MSEHKQLGELRLDWLKLTFDATVTEAVFELVGTYFGKPKECPKGFRGYRYAAQFACSSFICFSTDEKGAYERWDSHIDMSGTTLGQLPPRELYAFFTKLMAIISELYLRPWQCSRCDFAFDDFQWLVVPRTINEFAEAKNVSGFRKYHFHGSGVIGERTGDSIEFGEQGSKGSGKFLIVYDKMVQSGGKINSIRWELRFYDEKATQAIQRLQQVRNLDDFGRCMGEYIGGCIDFPIRNGDPNIERAERPSWWKEILEILGTARVRIERLETTLEEKLDYLLSHFDVTLSLSDEMFKRRGEPERLLQLIRKAICDGRRKWSQKHERLLPNLPVFEFVEIQDELPF